MMDLDTFIIMIYVFVDDWYRETIMPVKPQRGRPAKFSDSEALTLAIVSEWRVGVCWCSERGFIRYMHQHYSAWFPTLPQVSAFNERKRRLFGVLTRLQQTLGDHLSDQDDIYECVDCLPIPAGSLGQYSRDNGHWLWESTIGYGQGRLFWGDHLFVAIRPSGIISGWLVAAANIDERWLMEAFVSLRQGQAQLIGPPHRVKDDYASRCVPPVGFIGGWAAVGKASVRPYLADKGFNGYRWRIHWQQTYQATVWSVPPNNSIRERPWTRQSKKWLASKRQIIETAYALLTDAFDIKRLRAHSRWGQYTRIAAKIVGYHLGIWINRLLGRSDFTHATLLC
jgi:hypothetical protein